MLSFVAQKPPKLNLTDLNSGETLFVQFNPTQVRRAIKVAYARKAVLGQSHRPLQYTGTDNQTFPLDLFFDALDTSRRSANPFGDGDQSTAFGLGREARLFLESLAYPESEDDTILTEPPDVLIVWPKNFSLVCKLRGLEFQDTRFNVEGAPIQFTARTQWEESRISRLSSGLVRRIGSQRSKRNLGES